MAAAPADAFHVVCPTLPGFGFSGKPTTTGWGVERIAAAWAVLMARLGYDRYFAQGGDWGSAVTRSIGAQDPEHCAAIHITLAMGTRPRVDGEPTAEEQRAIKGAEYYQAWDSGYSKQQATRPQTVGYGLADSPAGQAAWILEKFWAWTDCDGHPENVLHRDELLDNLMFYWATNSAASSARIYWESFGKARATKLTVPVGVTVYPKEIVAPGPRLDGSRLSEHRPLVRAAQGRPLRGVRAARSLRRRHQGHAFVSSADRQRQLSHSASSWSVVTRAGVAAPREAIASVSAAGTRWPVSARRAIRPSMSDLPVEVVGLERGGALHQALPRRSADESVASRDVELHRRRPRTCNARRAPPTAPSGCPRLDTHACPRRSQPQRRVPRARPMPHAASAALPRLTRSLPYFFVITSSSASDNRPGDASIRRESSTAVSSTPDG